MSRKTVQWNLKVSPHLDKLLRQYIMADAYVTKSEFIRVAVRKLLEEESAKLEEAK